jgi:hypothetical protein
VVYADAAGAPGALIGRTNEVTIAAGRAPGWVTLGFASPVRLAAGSYWLGTHAGGTATVARYAYTAVADAFRRNGDAYGDGSSSPFGTPVADARQLSMEAVGG